MALFKKKSSTENAAKEFEETLVVAPETPEPFPEPEPMLEPDLGATLSDEPLPELPPDTPGSAPWSEPAPPPEPAFPADLEPHIRQDGTRLFLVEKQFDRPTKLSAENRITSAPRTALSETGWHPKHRTSLKEVHAQVDKLKAHQPTLIGNWLKGFKSTTLLKPKVERVPQYILDKKIVYESEGGFVVEVTYRDGTETRKKFFTASSTEGRSKALSQIESGRYAQIHVVDEERIGAMRAGRTGALPFTAGRINTYPITNASDVLEVEGIGEIFARRLHELGIHTTDQLRLMNATVIANNLGAPIGSVEKWQQMSELLLVPGIGKQSAELLVRSGVTSIDQLKKEKPKTLAAKTKAAVKGTRMRGIQAASARSWITAARKMKKSIQEFPTSVDG